MIVNEISSFTIQDHAAMTMEGAVNYASMEEEMMIITVVATEDIDCYKMDTNAKVSSSSY